MKRRYRVASMLLFAVGLPFLHVGIAELRKPIGLAKDFTSLWVGMGLMASARCVHEFGQRNAGIQE